MTHGESEFREVEAVFPPRLQGFVRAQSQCGLTSQGELWLGEWSDNTLQAKRRERWNAGGIHCC